MKPFKLLLIIFLAAVDLQAQERLVIGSASEIESKKIAEKLTSELKEMAQIQKQHLTRVAALHKRKPVKTLSRDQQEQVILHYKGEVGVRFGEPVFPEIDPKALKEMEKKAQQKLTELVDDYKKKATAKAPFPACLKNETELLKKVGKKDPKRKNAKDLLYLTEALKPEEDETVGKTVRVKVFPNEVYKDYQGLVAPFGFKCLPFRIHMGKRGLEMLRGELALRNYDEDPEGKLDRTMQRKWETYKNRARLRELEKEAQ